VPQPVMIEAYTLIEEARHAISFLNTFNNAGAMGAVAA
jgi:hypothetical protein